MTLSRSKVESQNPPVYPFATSPDIIRSYEKDVYIQSTLLEQVTNVLRPLYGTRFLHKYDSELHTLTNLLYFGVTTFLGNRTLGEEYCDIVQVESDSYKLPSLRKRGGYILSSILIPYTATKILPLLRSRIRNSLSLKSTDPLPSGFSVKGYILEHVDSITSPLPLHFLTLTLFYFSGAYYHTSKRLFGLRYIFTKRAPEERVGYEVLGVLLVIQTVVQAWLHLQQIVSIDSSAVSKGSEQEQKDGKAERGKLALSTPQQRIFAFTHTPSLDQPRLSLAKVDTMAWIDERQQRKCTLCLEEMKDPSATTCGHVFCWSCIGDWCREKAECPLCRQTSLPQHILPLQG